MIDYYLALLPGLIPIHARARLFMLSAGDADPIPLTHKVPQRPRLIARIKRLVTDPRRAHLVPFNTAWAIEVNLRKGGTAHPFLTLQFLTDGDYDWETNVFCTRSGQPKFLVASDHIESEDYRVLEISDLFTRW